MNISKELIYCIGLWLAEGDSVSKSELTFTNNSLELILFFKENIDRIYLGINKPRLYVYSAVNVKHFTTLDGFKKINYYEDLRANKPYYIYRLADVVFVRLWKELVKKALESEKNYVDLLIGLFAGEGNIKHDIINKNSKTVRIASKKSNEFIEKCLIKLNIPIKFDSGHREYWITGRNLEKLNSNNICILHPEKSHKFKKMFEYKKENHSPNELKKNLMNELFDFKTTKHLAKKYNRSQLKITEFLQDLKKENYCNYKKFNGRVFWAKNEIINDYNQNLNIQIQESMKKYGRNYTAIGKDIGLNRKSVKRELIRFEQNLQKS